MEKNQPVCPHCLSNAQDGSPVFGRLVRFGSFRRKSDRKKVTRFRCVQCQRTCSEATFDSCYGQKKRHLNEAIRECLTSVLTQRRTAKLLRIDRKTVER